MADQSPADTRPAGGVTGDDSAGMMAASSGSTTASGSRGATAQGGSEIEGAQAGKVTLPREDNGSAAPGL
jgi:hypothetical protein